MIAQLRSWRMPANRRPRRTRHAVQSLAEALETRSVLSVSVTANIGGLMPPVLSLTIPLQNISQTDISLILKLSTGETRYLRDSVSGKVLHNVNITLRGGKHGKDTINLTDAVIDSYRLIQDPTQDEPSVALTLEGQTKHTGSMATTIDGVTLPVVGLTIPQPTTSSAQQFSLFANPSQGETKWFQDAATGKLLPAVQLTLDRLGNGSTSTINLTNVLISSIQFIYPGDVPVLEMTLAAQQETIRQ